MWYQGSKHSCETSSSHFSQLLVHAKSQQLTNVRAFCVEVEANPKLFEDWIDLRRAHRFGRTTRGRVEVDGSPMSELQSSTDCHFWKRTPSKPLARMVVSL